MKNQSKILVAVIAATQLTSAVTVFAAQTSVVEIASPAAMGVEGISAENFEPSQKAQAEKIKSMSEAEIRMALELDATRIENAVAQAEATGAEVSAESKEQLLAFAEAIHQEAAKPKVKKRLLQKMMIVPRGFAQGLGYLGYAVADLFIAPVIISGSFVNALIAGEGRSTALNVIGFTGMFATNAVAFTATVLVLGPAFPVVIGSLIPLMGTSALVCSKKEGFKSPHTAKFCNNISKNDELMTNVWNAGDDAGYAVNRFLTAPFRKIFKKK